MATRRRGFTLTLIRRGETTWEAQGRLHGRSDLPMAEEGRGPTAAEAALLAAPPPTIYHAPDEAAAETARIVIEAGGSAGGAEARSRDVEELAPVDLGLLEGLTASAFAERFGKRHKQWQDDPMALAPPEGEPVAEARARQFASVARLMRRARGDLGLVLSPLCLGLLRCHLADRSPREAWAMVAGRPRIERYLVAVEAIERLERAAGVSVS